MREPMPEGLANYFLFLFFLYILSGVFGTAWISDEFDEIRFAAVSMIGVPAVCFYFFAGTIWPDWKKQWVKARVGLQVVIALVFLWGNVLVLNAIGDNTKEVVVSRKVGQYVMNLKERRGNLGIIYSRRWW